MLILVPAALATATIYVTEPVWTALTVLVALIVIGTGHAALHIQRSPRRDAILVGLLVVCVVMLVAVLRY